jgi:class 3 adenylate cyclase
MHHDLTGAAAGWTSPALRGGRRVARSIVVKNLLLFLAILVVAVVPLAVQYERDSRAYEIQNLASTLEFFAERGATWLDVGAITTLTRPEAKSTDAYRRLLADLRRIRREFGVDNAVVMRRQPDGRYTYVAIDHDGFDIGEPAEIHALFPDTYRATEDTWQAGEMMHSRLFGGRVAGEEYAQFVQINTPLKLDGRVVAILMLNKFADPVADAVRAKTIRVVALSAGLIVVGLALFGLVSARMLRPLRTLTEAAGRVAQGDLGVVVPEPRSADEVGSLTRAFQSMLQGLRQRDFIRDTFGRYVSPEVAQTVLASADGLRLGGDRREITLLVTDLRGFSVLAERLPAEDVIACLNRYLERMVDVLSRHRATIDEFQGDGILAFFGAPLAAPDDAERAVVCAIEMQRTLATLNDEQRVRGGPELAMGIGIHTGEVIVGNIGSERRVKYGAVGAAINLAYRIESQTVGGQVLISPTTYERVRALVDLRGSLEAYLKGVAEVITLYDVGAVRGSRAVALPAAARAPLVPVEPPLPVICHPVDQGRVAAVGIRGLVVRASREALAMRLAYPVAPRSTVVVTLDGADLRGPHQVYGKVERVDAMADGSVVALVVTTSLPAEMQRLLQPRASIEA